jgi:hypothetical protein
MDTNPALAALDAEIAAAQAEYEEAEREVERAERFVHVLTQARDRVAAALAKETPAGHMPVAEKTPRRPKGWLDEKIAQVLAHEGMGARDIAVACGEKQSAVNASLARMVASGRLVRSGEFYEVPTADTAE